MRIAVPKRPIVAPRRQRGFLINPYRFTAAAPTGFVCDAAHFDGTAARMDRAGTFTGQASSGSGIFSIWLKASHAASLAGNFVFLMDQSASPGNAFFSVNLTSGLGAGFNEDGIQIAGFDSTVTRVFGVTTSSGLTDASTAWIHYLVSWNTATPAVKVMVNGADHSADGTVDTVSGSVALASANAPRVGYLNNLGTVQQWYQGGMAEVYFAPGQYLDVTVAANLQKFRTSGGKPENLGTDGSTPTGTAPLVYLHLDDLQAASNFATNRTGKGNYTITGTLTTEATSPSD